MHQDLSEAKAHTQDVEAKYSKQVDKLQREIKALSQRLDVSTGTAQDALQAAQEREAELKRAMKAAQAEADKALKEAAKDHRRALKEADSKAAQDRKQAYVGLRGWKSLWANP